MPYSGPADPNLPSNVKALPENKRAQWAKVWNSAYSNCMSKNKGGGPGTAKTCEATAFRFANGVAKGVEMAELETVDVPAIEIMAEGTWNGDEYTRHDLDSMVEAFSELKGQVDPPVKLGHDDKQRLAQKDGFPALGWVKRLYRKGGTLLADLRDVPRRIADLITAGAYQKVSSEIYFDREVDGKVYPLVLKAIALLGGDMPAVKDIKSIGDIEGLYDDPALWPIAEAHYAEVDIGTLKSIDPNVGGGIDRDKLPAADFAGPNRSFPIVKPGDVSDAASSLGHAKGDTEPIKAKIIAIAKRKGAAFVAQLPQAWKDEANLSEGTTLLDYLTEMLTQLAEAPAGDESRPLDGLRNVAAEFRNQCLRMEKDIAGKPGAKKLRTFFGECAATLDRMLGADKQHKEAVDMDIKTLAAALGMPKDATEEQVLAKVAELKPAPEAAGEVAKLREEVGKGAERILTLERERLTEAAYAEADGAIAEGRFVPAQREDLRAYAVRDLDAFKKFVASSPKLAILGEALGHEHEGDDGEDGEPTAAESEVARQMGTTAAQLAMGRKSTVKLIEENKGKFGSTGLAVDRARA